MFKKRHYRVSADKEDLVLFESSYYESDLLISAEHDLRKEADERLKLYHGQIRRYIDENPDFGFSLSPLPFDNDAPDIVKTMYIASEAAAVGPMATVAGAIAMFVGNDLLSFSQQVIVENGGDIFVKTRKPRKIGVFAGIGCAFNKLVFTVYPDNTPCGICASSGKFGHSLSFGNSNITIVIAGDAAVADGFATGIANMIKSDDDLAKAVEKARISPQISAIIAATDSKLTAYGNIEFDILDNEV